MGNLGCMFKLPWKRDIRVDRNYSFRFRFFVQREMEREREKIITTFFLSL